MNDVDTDSLPIWRSLTNALSRGKTMADTQDMPVNDHASLVAREYGIPAVVGTGDATARLRDGQIVTVDGSAGAVEYLT